MSIVRINKCLSLEHIKRSVDGTNDIEAIITETMDRFGRRKATDYEDVLMQLCIKQQEALRYWSYCTRQGMLKECPEKNEEFVKTMESFGIYTP